MSRLAVLGLTALSIGISGCQRATMKTVPRVSNTATNVVPGGVYIPRPTELEPVDHTIITPGPQLPPRFPEGEPPDLEPPVPPTPPTPPLPPYYPPTTPTTPTDIPTTPDYPLPPPQPPTTPPQPPTTPPNPPPRPPLPPLPPPPQPPLPPPPQPPITTNRPTTRPLPRPLPAPVAQNVAPRPTAVAVNTPRSNELIGSPMPPMRPAGLMPKVAVAQAKPMPVATPATAPEENIVIRKPIEPVDGRCEPCPVKVTKQNRKLDILFVVDTSSSLVKGAQDSREGGELRQIAHGVPEFVKRLPSDTDYRIGVLLAHGPTVPNFDRKGRRTGGKEKESPYFGRLFSAGSNDPAVLDRRKLSPDQIVAKLERKMMSVPADRSDAQGEALIMGLFELTSNTQRIAEAHKQGFFGKDRNLVIIMVTDEQDACYSYAGTNNRPTLKMYEDAKGNVTWEQDRNELAFFNGACSQKYGHLVTYKDAEASLKRLESTLDGKVIVQAIAYTQPQKPRAMNEDENEQAHGVLELVNGMGGKVADMANVNRNTKTISFANELTILGENAGFLLKYSSSFACASNTYHPNSIDQKSIRLRIVDDGQRPIATYAKECAGDSCQNADGGLSVSIESLGDKKGLRVRPSNLKAYTDAMTRATQGENAQYVIEFKTKAGVRTEDGLPADAPTAKSKAPVSKTPPAVKAKTAKTKKPKA